MNVTWGPKKMKQMLRRCLLHIAFDNVQEQVFSGQVWPQEGECSQNGFAIATVFDYNVTWRVPAGFLCGLLVPGPLGDDPPLFPEFF